MARVLTLLFALVPAVLLASTPGEFQAARNKYGITSVAMPQVFKELQGEAYLEFQGRVTGSIKGEGGVVTLLVRFGDAAQIVEAKVAPDWMLTGVTEVRMIVRATASELSALPTLEHVASIPELDAMALDERVRILEAKKAEEASKKAAALQNEMKTQSRHGLDRFMTTAPPNALNGPIGSAGKSSNSELVSLVPDYMAVVMDRNKGLPAIQAQFIAECVLAYSTHYGVDARLVMALIQHESNFNPQTTSHAGAMGLGQLMPDTAKGLGITNPYDVEQNIYGTVRTLRGHLDRQGALAKDTYDQLVRALAAYNAGPGAVKKYGGVPPYNETKTYITRVVNTYLKLSGKQ